jgi:hypothetical protein
MATNGDTVFGAQLATNLSKAMSNLTKTPKWLDFQKNYVLAGKICTADDANSASGLAQVQLNEIAGLYVVYSVLAAVGVLIAAVQGVRLPAAAGDRARVLNDRESAAGNMIEMRMRPA